VTNVRDLDLSSIDLNMLVVLDALLRERHVTAAARRLHTSQPAVSRVLARLRELFDDELLVRVGQRMFPTPKGLTLEAPLREALQRLHHVVQPERFDPTTATGVLRIAAPDIIVYMLGPALLARLARAAPNVDVEITQWSSAWREDLASGNVDVTFGIASGDEPGIYSRLLARNDWACVVRAGHPVLRRRWGLDTYLELSHLLIGFTSHGAGQVDDALAALGRTRRIGLRIPYAILSPLMIAETDLVLTTARWLAAKLARKVGLVIKPPPVALTPVDLPMVWHERSHRDPRQRWFRDTLHELATGAGLVSGKGAVSSRRGSGAA
jgi:DNA-binding transcriptional LysR family regulator